MLPFWFRIAERRAVRDGGHAGGACRGGGAGAAGSRRCDAAALAGGVCRSEA